ncbi:MAG: glycerol-3-phosphate acyltransferase [Dehalococcoidia bacterium]|nr:glycerol-3-phosphate acyltransferase [Dehalococcoidia bacterium]MSQ17536.1 glycerol-3-phosphate acyltransferase [Dehalococcoidia bacterium]
MLRFDLAGLYLLACLVGAVPTAYLIARWVKGIDIRRYGSGNVGGTNLAQQTGKVWLAPLGLFEVLVKGAGPVWLGRYVLNLEPWSVVLLVAPLLAVAGHNWSAWLKFRDGGRGLAVASGTLLALSPPLLGAFLAVALAGWLATRSAGVWVLISLALLPLWARLTGQPPALMWYCLALLILLVAKRLVSNWTPLPAGLPRSKVLLNRLLRDRDVDRREDWVARVPDATEV